MPAPITTTLSLPAADVGPGHPVHHLAHHFGRQRRRHRRAFQMGLDGGASARHEVGLNFRRIVADAVVGHDDVGGPPLGREQRLIAGEMDQRGQQRGQVRLGQRGVERGVI